MHYGFHHHLKLRRQNKTKGTWLKFIFDKVAYAAGVMIAIMTAPQIWQIYSTHNAQGVSVFTWLMYGLGSCFWIGYGFVHHEKPIVFTNIVSASLQLVVAIGAILYS